MQEAVNNPWGDLEMARETALFLVRVHDPVQPYHITVAVDLLVEGFTNVGLVPSDKGSERAQGFFHGVIAGLIHEWTRSDKGASGLGSKMHPDRPPGAPHR